MQGIGEQVPGQVPGLEHTYLGPERAEQGLHVSRAQWEVMCEPPVPISKNNPFTLASWEGK